MPTGIPYNSGLTIFKRRIIRHPDAAHFLTFHTHSDYIQCPWLQSFLDLKSTVLKTQKIHEVYIEGELQALERSVEVREDSNLHLGVNYLCPVFCIPLRLKKFTVNHFYRVMEYTGFSVAM